MILGSDWVSASSTRNYLLQDPILDWFKLYGKVNGYQRDDEIASYDPRLDFTRHIMAQGVKFEEHIVGLLAEDRRRAYRTDRG